MFYEDETSIAGKRRDQINYSTAYGIYEGLLYHYTKLDTMWKILESDSLFARNIRFSNDFNEYMTGRNAIEKFVSGLDDLKQDGDRRDELLSRIRNHPMMYYMVCFCNDGNLLSQWRGYAQNGVSLGMDFTDGMKKAAVRQHVERFCVLNNRRYQSAAEGGDEKKYSIGGAASVFVQMPYAVQYISEGNTGKLKTILEELYDGSDEAGVNQLIRYIPYIKDIGFQEEHEYRLIFDMEFLGGSKAHSSDIRSKKLDFLEAGQLKKPYINVEFGNPEDKCKKVKNVRLGRGLRQLKSALKKGFSEMGEDCGKIKIDQDASREGICIGEGNNQEEVQEAIEKQIEAAEGLRGKPQVKIWCKGHLPIRRITIGPGERQEEIRESLESYKDTVYWLRYVDIDLSNIPLRNS